jgi:hypothetical protein
MIEKIIIEEDGKFQIIRQAPFGLLTTFIDEATASIQDPRPKNQSSTPVPSAGDGGTRTLNPSIFSDKLIQATRAVIFCWKGG